MRKKLIALVFALIAAAAAQLLSVAPTEAAGACKGFLVCCSPTGPCYCCPRPCPIQCP